MSRSPPPDTRCLALVGPTAAGKTAAALALAQRFPLEIISVDSALVFRGMDIGTAKPSAAERAAVPHHLVDIRDPLHAYSAAEFARDAYDLVRAINTRGRMALLTGGTMLYLKALVTGLHTMPGADASVRATIEREAASVGWPALHAQLARVDAVTAARLAPHDGQRIQRALEVYRTSGRPLSAWHADTLGRAPVSAFADMAVFSLEPNDRSWLHQRINQRFEAMLEAGLLDEVRALRARGDLHRDLPAMRCVGYRQAWEALDGDWPMDELPARGSAATRQLAKRQLTWLRGMPQRHVLASDTPGAVDRVLALCAQLAGAAA